MANDYQLKDPANVEDFTRDWSAYLVPREDTIATSTWTATPDGITIDSDTHDDTTATVWLAGGTAGVTYDVVNTITTADGRTKERTTFVRVEEQ